jgi:hypothetical protein
MRGRTLFIAAAGAIVGAGIAGGAVAVAVQDDSGINGATAEKAASAAIAAADGGRVTSLDQDNEGVSVWEVEVTKPDGSTVDVTLDRDFKVISAQRDNDTDDDANEPADPNDAADDAAEAAGQDQEGPGDPEQDPGEPPDDADDVGDTDDD